MKLIHLRETKLFRATNILLIFALLFDVSIPFAKTLNHYSIVRAESKKHLSLPSEVIVGQSASEKIEEVALKPEVKNVALKATQTTTSNNSPGGSGFSIGSTDNLVDPFTGDFSYSIPLMDVEGYPITLSYNSNVTMNTEASWVGLGWNLNVGSIEREMRGIPDEFDGKQKITREVNQLNDNTTDGVKAGKYWSGSVAVDLNDIVTLNLGYSNSKLYGAYKNTYLGVGHTFDKATGWNVGVGVTLYYVGLNIGGSFGKTYNYDSKRGLNIGTGGGLNGGITVFGVGPNLSTYSSKNFNSRAGVTGKTTTRGWGLGAGSVIGMSRSRTSTVPYGSQTMVPRVQFNAINKGSSYTRDRYGVLQTSAYVGVSFTFGKLAQLYESYRQEIKNNNTIVQPAIGFLHSSKKMTASGSTLPIMDFNRSNDTRYSDAMTNLPFSMQTFDIFYANAMGMQGTFRAYRADAGTYEDPETEDNSTEITVVDKKGWIPDLSTMQCTYEKESGGGLTLSKTESEAGLKKMNGTHLLEFTTGVDPVNGFDNAIYFKGVGENVPVDASLYSDFLGGFTATRARMLVSGAGVSLLSSTIDRSGQTYPSLPSNGKVSLSKPTVANYFRPRTVKDLSASPNRYERNYYSYAVGPNPVVSEIPRSGKDENIISRIEVTNTEGAFFGYGIPSFSNSSSQVTFNIGSNSGNPTLTPDAQGLISYSTGDNSVSNTKGLANYYDRTTVPAYAGTFLLTDMHSADYIDRTGDGPSLDDIGNYYKFNYTQLHTDFHWRFPIGQQKAFYMEGTKGSELDDVATYSAGSKEVWVTHSVESKNYIAEFILSPVAREDGYGINESGAKISTEKTYSLKRIELYSRAERQAKGINAKPLQVVEFEYNYELCQNYPSNTNPVTTQRGKLTLLAVRTYTEASLEMYNSAYRFDYGSGAIDNPDFNYGAIDAWGQSKPGNAQYNSRFPYVAQSKTSADNNAQAWKLKRITTPNGGKLEVTYESDTYGYVQDKKVMKHLKMEGLTNIFDLFSMKNENILNPSKIRQTLNTPAAVISTFASEVIQLNTIYEMKYGTFSPNHIPNNIVVFKLDQPISTGVTENQANEKVKEDYFMDGNKALKELYLKAHIRVSDANPNRSEIVPVFAGISEDLTSALNNFYPVDDAKAIGVLPPLSGSSEYTYGYVILKPYRVRNAADETFSADNMNENSMDDEAFNPIQKAAYDFFQRSLTDVVYQNTAFSSGANSLDLLTGARVDISKAMRFLNFGTTLVAEYNTLRVYIPSKIKYGGDARVKSIEYFDNWQAISTEYNSSYKWNYLYEFDGKTSGVASYESRTANDESAFYEWDTYYDIRVKYPDQFNYTPKPVMELLYPSGSVGYSKVAVQFNNLTDRGYSISEYYTAKDKPTRESITNLRRDFIFQQVKKKGTVEYFRGFAQGFSIETNDFHGKIRSHMVYKGVLDLETNPGEALSKVTYEYYDSGEKQKLSDEKGVLEEREIGMEYDIHADSRMIKNRTIMAYAGRKKSWILPLMAPNGFHNNKSTSYSAMAFYSHALIKHANRSAILKSVKTEYMGSENTAERIVFDKYSGAVILSSLTDEFNDKLYSLNYPAHWYYSELKNVSASQDKVITLTLGSNTTITNPALLKQLSPGDKLKFPDGKFAWVTKSYPWPSTPKYFLIDELGNEFSIAAGTYAVTVFLSGRSNEITASMQQVVTKTNPLPVSATEITFPTTGILSAEVLTFRDKLNALCGTNPEGSVSNNNLVAIGVANPYRYGLRGDLVMDNQLSWQEERIQATANGVRKDGAFTSFVPFYGKATSGDWYPLTHSSHPNYSATLGNYSWRKTGEVTLYNQYGAPLEAKDEIKVNAAQLYGYNPKLELLPIASAVNAHKQDIAFDGFEDYGYYETQAMTNFKTHFAFVPQKGDNLVFSTDYRHSGRTSLVLVGSRSVSGERDLSLFQDAKTLHADNTTNTGQVQNCDCIQTFAPTPGDYVIGAWVKQPSASAGNIDVIVYGVNNSVLVSANFSTNGTSLDGWQRIEGTLNIPPNSLRIKVMLSNTTAGNVYFDDFRMHPFSAGMTTTVYDPATLLKIATHDGYNYTTFYNYDENNQLVRVRVETSEGIKTVSESEMSIYKQP